VPAGTTIGCGGGAGAGAGAAACPVPGAPAEEFGAEEESVPEPGAELEAEFGAEEGLGWLLELSDFPHPVAKQKKSTTPHIDNLFFMRFPQVTNVAS
jgi:hypothetical protein